MLHMMKHWGLWLFFLSIFFRKVHNTYCPICNKLHICRSGMCSVVFIFQWSRYCHLSPFDFSHCPFNFSCMAYWLPLTFAVLAPSGTTCRFDRVSLERACFAVLGTVFLWFIFDWENLLLLALEAFGGKGVQGHFKGF